MMVSAAANDVNAYQILKFSVWGKNVIVNLLNLSKNLIYNKKSFYATASIASHRTPAELCRFCDALNVHGFNRTQRYSVQFSVQFELTESAQTPYLHLEFFDEQIAFIPFHYAVISMDEWNEWNEFDKRQKTDFRTKKKCQSLNGAFKCSSPALSLLRMEDHNKIQPLYLYVWGWTCS